MNNSFVVVPSRQCYTVPALILSSLDEAVPVAPQRGGAGSVSDSQLLCTRLDNQMQFVWASLSHYGPHRAVGDLRPRTSVDLSDDLGKAGNCIHLIK